MNVCRRTAAAFLGFGLLLVAVTSTAAPPVVKAPAASRYYAFLGHWRGKGEFAVSGEAPVRLAIRVSCFKAASGWAVRCAMVAKGERTIMTEADLFGVDAVTGKGHWYALTNQGDANDLVTEWTDAKTMHARCGWIQEGKRMEEKVRFVLPRRRKMEFRSVVTANGRVLSVFSGRLTR